MKKMAFLLSVCAFGMWPIGVTWAQEASIHHGFLFFAGESYTVDEETFEVYQDGHLYKDLIKDNRSALDSFESYETWHTMALVTTGASIASFLFGGAFYLFEKDMSEALGDNAGMIGLAGGGGLLVISMVLEFVAWGKISDSADIYNKRLEVGSVLDGVPIPSVTLAQGGAQLGLTWRF